MHVGPQCIRAMQGRVRQFQHKQSCWPLLAIQTTTYIPYQQTDTLIHLTVLTHVCLQARLSCENYMPTQWPGGLGYFNATPTSSYHMLLPWFNLSDFSHAGNDTIPTPCRGNGILKLYSYHYLDIWEPLNTECFQVNWIYDMYDILLWIRIVPLCAIPAMWVISPLPPLPTL